MTRFPDPVVLIGGAPRSGTTLVRNMLASHPQVAVPDESYFIARVHQNLVRNGLAGDLELAWRLIRTHRYFVAWVLDPADVEVLLAAAPPSTYGDLVRALFAAYAGSRNKAHGADKTTTHAQHFDWLASLFPTSGLVHVVRDPREACMSLAVQHWQLGEEGGLGRSQHRLAGAAVLWKRHVGPALEAGRRFGPRLLALRYEDLVRDPETELRRLCTLARVPFDAAVLRYAEAGEALPESHHVRSRQPVATGARPWARELSRDDIAIIELVTGPLMDELGYERTAGSRSLRAAAELVGYHIEEAMSWWARNVGPPLHRLRSGARA